MTRRASPRCWLLNLFTIGAGATAIFAILKIAFTGTPN